MLGAFEDLVHGVSTRLEGNMSLKLGDQSANRLRRRAFVSSIDRACRKVIAMHTDSQNAVGTVALSNETGGLIETPASFVADGLMTTARGVALLATYADCLPVLFYEPRVGAVGLVHAGWKGIVQEVVTKQVRAMQQDLDADPARLVVYVGPSIQACCFDVPDDVWDQFQHLKGGRAACVRFGSVKRVSLQQVCVAQLVAVGVPEHNIEVSAECTSCDRQSFYSHRRDGENRQGAIAAMIGLREIAHDVPRSREIPTTADNPSRGDWRRRHEQSRGSAA